MFWPELFLGGFVAVVVYSLITNDERSLVQRWRPARAGYRGVRYVRYPSTLRPMYVEATEDFTVSLKDISSPVLISITYVAARLKFNVSAFSFSKAW